MSTYASPLPSGKTSPQGFLRVFGKVFTSSGVIEADALKVTAQTTPDMTVRVSGSSLNDNAVFIHTDGHFIQAWNDSIIPVDIEPNSSGVIKTDAIVAYVDLAAGILTPNNPGALKFVAVRRSGTSTGAPTAGEIITAVSSNPYIMLAPVTVANGATSINSGNITDQRVRATMVAPMLEAIYPVGSIYTNAAVDTNPSVLFGFGTWLAFGAGRVLVGVDAGQTEFDTLGETGGAKTHTLTEAEMPSHNHNAGTAAANVLSGSGGNALTNFTDNSGTSSTGGNGAHNNLQPYITVYMWRRTA